MHNKALAGRGSLTLEADRERDAGMLATGRLGRSATPGSSRGSPTRTEDGIRGGRAPPQDTTSEDPKVLP